MAGVFDGQRLLLFVNGRLQSESPELPTTDDAVPASPGAAGLPYFIGANESSLRGGMHRFVGLIDEVRISNIARYTEDFTPPRRHETDEHTLLLCHCDDGEGNVLIDCSGQQRHGKIVGANWVKPEGTIPE